MLASRFRELEAAKAKLAELEKAVTREREVRLAGLHTELGYDSRAALITALGQVKSDKSANGRSPKTKAARAGVRRKRARITPEMRSEIVKALRDGAKGSAVRKQFGISLPSVYLIKKAAGLTKARGKAAAG